MTEFIFKAVIYIKRYIALFISSFVTVVFSYVFIYHSWLQEIVGSIRIFISSAILVCTGAFMEFTVSAIKYIKEYRIIIVSIFVIIVVIHSLKIIIRLFIYFSGYIRLALHLSRRITGFLLQMGRRSFYIDAYAAWKKNVSLFIYNVLVRLDDLFTDYTIIQEPEKWSILFKKILKPVSHFVQPLSAFFPGISRLWRKEEKVHRFIEGEEKRLSSINEIPVEVLNQFTDVKETGLYFFPDDWIQTINKAIDLWKQGNVSNILVHGGMGTGKTGLLNHINHLLRNNYMVKRFSLNRNQMHISGKDFFDFLHQQKMKKNRNEKQIALVDDIECLFYRNIEGFEQIRQLIHTIQLSGENTLWIITASSSFYDFLNQIIPLYSVFQFYINGDGLSVDALINVFHYTLQSIGYSFHILPDKQMLKIIRKRLRTKLISSEEVDINLKKLFFESFLSVGKGNMYFHFNYFLKSMKSVRGNKLFLTQPELPDMINNLNKLSITDLHILQSLFLHKNLTIEQLAEILLVDLQVISFSVNIMSHNKIISQDGDGYTINRIHYNIILQFLKTHNIL